jgi:hypothetical protein
VTSPLAPGDYERPQDNNQLLAKVSHQLTPSHSLVGRFSLDRPVTHNVSVGNFNLPEVGYDSITEDFTYAGTLASVLSNRALNELRVQVSDARIGADHDNPDAFTIMRPTSTSGKLSNIPQAFAELRFQLVDNFSYERGAHRFKAGLDVNRVALDGYVYQNVPGVFVFNTDRPFNAADPTTYPTTFIGNTGDPTWCPPASHSLRKTRGTCRAT